MLGLVLVAALAVGVAGCGGSQRSVSYRGLTIDVPSSWSVNQRSTTPCGVLVPSVLVGPPFPTKTAQCPGLSFRATAVTFGGPDPAPPALGKETRESPNGVPALVSSRLSGNFVDGYTWYSLARFPQKKAWVFVRSTANTSQAARDQADQVLDSVHDS